ncbi:MAG: type III secretion HpaP family protein [Parvibaculaceae bacterium]|nr:type III secretion HpaP family protein [Parvibaculaceae bacterium]
MMKLSATDSLKASDDCPASFAPALPNSALSDRFSALMAGLDRDSENGDGKEENRNRKKDKPTRHDRDCEIVPATSTYVQGNPEKSANPVRAENPGTIPGHLSPLADAIINNVAIFATRPLNKDSEISLSLAERLLPDTRVTLRRSGDTIHVDFSTAQAQSAAFLAGNQAGLAAALGERLRMRVNIRINLATAKNKSEEAGEDLHGKIISAWPGISC